MPAGLAPEHAKHVLGVQGNLWAEFIPNYRHLQYMAYPRACALAEIGWTPAGQREWEDFQARMQAHAARLQARGVALRPLTPAHRVGGWQPAELAEQFKTLEWDVTPWMERRSSASAPAERPVRVEFMYESGAHRLDIEWVALLADGVEVARDTHAGFTGDRSEKNEYKLPLKEYRAGVKYIIRASIRSGGGMDSRGSVWIWE
jgi:hexosaminidase